MDDETGSMCRHLSAHIDYRWYKEVQIGISHDDRDVGAMLRYMHLCT